MIEPRTSTIITERLGEALEHLEATYFGHSDDGRIVAGIVRTVLDLTTGEQRKEVPRGFTRCDECEGEREELSEDGYYVGPCPSCSGSGLVPTEKLREDVARAASIQRLRANDDADLADAVLAKVAEHLGDRE